MPISEEEIVEFVNKKTVKELDKILRLKGRSLKGNKKDKQSRVLNVILSERGNEEKTAEDEGEVTAEAEGKTVDYTVLPSNKDVEHTEPEQLTEVEGKLNDMEQRLKNEMKDQMQDIHNVLISLLSAQASPI